MFSQVKHCNSHCEIICASAIFAVGIDTQVVIDMVQDYVIFSNITLPEVIISKR